MKVPRDSYVLGCVQAWLLGDGAAYQSPSAVASVVAVAYAAWEQTSVLPPDARQKIVSVDRDDYVLGCVNKWFTGLTTVDWEGPQDSALRAKAIVDVALHAWSEVVKWELLLLSASGQGGGAP